MKSNSWSCNEKKRIWFRKSIPVLQYSLDGDFIKEWPSALQVERELGFIRKSVLRACRGAYDTAHGYKWKFKNEDQK
jgi:hypothetical protein